MAWNRRALGAFCYLASLGLLSWVLLDFWVVVGKWPRGFSFFFFLGLFSLVEEGTFFLGFLLLGDSLVSLGILCLDWKVHVPISCGLSQPSLQVFPEKASANRYWTPFAPGFGTGLLGTEGLYSLHFYSPFLSFYCYIINIFIFLARLFSEIIG